MRFLYQTCYNFPCTIESALSYWAVGSLPCRNTGGENMAITNETMILLLQFGGFIIALLGLVVAIVVALTKKK